MATFDSFFKYVLRDGEAVIKPRGTSVELFLGFYDHLEEFRYQNWRDSMCDPALDPEGEFSRIGEDQANAAGVDIELSSEKSVCKTIAPHDNQGRYCLKIALMKQNEYIGGGLFFYRPEEGMIELHRYIPRSQANPNPEDWIDEAKLRSILCPFYDQLPSMRAV